MAIEELFDHTCDIYHVETKTRNLGFGITGDEDFVYPQNPSEASVICHFNVSAEGTLTQTESGNVFLYTGKLNLPIGTDIRVNDKIVDLSNGLVYTAEIPKNIRDHHMIVKIHRKGTVKGVL